jgi:hypothetical protein
MNRSDLFTAAHTLTRLTLRAGDEYQVNFGAALRWVYANRAAAALLLDGETEGTRLHIEGGNDGEECVSVWWSDNWHGWMLVHYDADLNGTAHEITHRLDWALHRAPVLLGEALPQAA